VTDANDYTDKSALGTIARQEAGLGLLSAFDPPTATTTSFKGRGKARGRPSP
jgi:hypothetical protein